MPGGWIILNPSRGQSVRLLLNSEPDRSGGVGGWEETERALRRPARWWKGLPSETMSLDCTLDDDAPAPAERSVGKRLENLKKMGMHSEDDDPPTIKIRGDIWFKDRSLTWVMDGLSFGARLYNRDGSLRRQQVTVDLARYIGIDEIHSLRIRKTRTKKRKRKHRTVTSRRGETLRGIALRALGSPSRWKDLRKWNKKKLGKVDPDMRLRPGTHIKIRG